MVKREERRVGGEPPLRIFLAPSVIEKANPGREHLRAGQEESVSERAADLLGFRHRCQAPIGIDKAVRPHQATQCSYLSGPEPCLSTSGRFRSVRFGVLSPAPDA